MWYLGVFKQLFFFLIFDEHSTYQNFIGLFCSFDVGTQCIWSSLARFVSFKHNFSWEYVDVLFRITSKTHSIYEDKNAGSKVIDFEYTGDGAVQFQAQTYLR